MRTIKTSGIDRKFETIDNGIYIIRSLKGGFFNGKLFSDKKKTAKKYSFEKVHAPLKQLRTIGIPVTFEMV